MLLFRVLRLLKSFPNLLMNYHGTMKPLFMLPGHRCHSTAVTVIKLIILNQIVLFVKPFVVGPVSRQDTYVLTVQKMLQRLRPPLILLPSIRSRLSPNPKTSSKLFPVPTRNPITQCPIAHGILAHSPFSPSTTTTVFSRANFPKCNFGRFCSCYTRR